MIIMAQKFFILGTGLSGTHFLGNSLKKISNIVSYHEIHPLMAKAGARYIRLNHKTFRHARIRNYLPLEFIYRYKFKLTRLPKIPFGKDKIFVEANSALGRVIPIVRSAFPDSKIVHIIRDPRSFVRSAICRGWFMNKNLFTPLNGIYTGDFTKREWFLLTPFARASWAWLRQHRMVQENNPDLVLDFDDIFKGEHTGFLKLLNFIKPDAEIGDLETFFVRKDRPTRFKVIPSYSEWEPEWQKQIEEAVEVYDSGDLFKSYT